MVRNHLYSIEITCDQTIPSLAQFLRRLVVEEWTGTFRSEYQAFLTNHATIEEEAQAFLTDGHYSTSLGDAMPLAMANVLQLPLLIFTRGDFVRFMTVFPPYNVDCIAPLPLAYTNNGPGHYDALIPAEDSPSNDDAETNEKPGDKTASVSPNKKTELKHKKTNFCRCGINKKRESMKKGETPRKYKSRYGCLIHFSKCSLDCKCKGLCGGTDCKEKATIQDTSPKCSRQTRKRGKNPIQTASEKKKKCLWKSRKDQTL